MLYINSLKQIFHTEDTMLFKLFKTSFLQRYTAIRRSIKR